MKEYFSPVKDHEDWQCETCKRWVRGGAVYKCYEDKCPLPHKPFHNPVATITIEHDGKNFITKTDSDWIVVTQPRLMFTKDGTIFLNAVFSTNQSYAEHCIQSYGNATST